MHVLRILLLVMTAGVLAFIVYQAITRQIPRDAFWTVIAIACGFSLNLIFLWFSKPGGPPVAIEDKPPVVMEEKAPVVEGMAGLVTIASIRAHGLPQQLAYCFGKREGG